MHDANVACIPDVVGLDSCRAAAVYLDPVLSLCSTSLATAQEAKTSDKPSKPSFSFPGVNSAAPKSGKAPSFGSFSSAAASGKGMPSFQETVMMRLKNAQREKERKALEEEIVKEDEAADANGSR